MLDDIENDFKELNHLKDQIQNEQIYDSLDEDSSEGKYSTQEELENYDENKMEQS